MVTFLLLLASQNESQNVDKVTVRNMIEPVQVQCTDLVLSISGIVLNSTGKSKQCRYGTEVLLTSGFKYNSSSAVYKYVFIL